MGVSYKNAKRFIGQPVQVKSINGQQFSGVVQRVSKDTVWMIPLANNRNHSTTNAHLVTADSAVGKEDLDLQKVFLPFLGGGFNPMGLLNGMNPYKGFNPLGGGSGFNPMGNLFGGGNKGFNPFGTGGFNPWLGPFGGMGGGLGSGGLGSGGFNPLGMFMGGLGGLGGLGGSGGGFPIPLNLLLNMASRFIW